MDFDLSRRQFLKLGLLTAGAWSTTGMLAPAYLRQTPGDSEQPYPLAIGRVAAPAIYLYKEPSFQSERLGMKARDQLLNLLAEVPSEAGPPRNPLWYQVKDGYVHSGRIQRIELLPANPTLDSVPETGALGEITVPYVRSFHYSRSSGWQQLYRLYYESLHWIVGIDEGPDRRPWYRLRDSLNNAIYHAPARSLRPVAAQEFSPISQDVPAEEKRILISIEEQTLTAYESDRQVLRAPISSGLHSEKVEEGQIPTDTPTGNFHIQLKMPSRHMGDGNLTGDIHAYELPGVPWAMAFHETGVAMHGTYWHDNFGTRMSHGCVNLKNVDAKWLFRWSDPAYDPADWYTAGYGTLVQVA